MTSHLFHGVRLPDAVAGHVALDFVNSRAGWGEPRPKEYLTSAGVVLAWCHEQRLLPEAAIAELRARVERDGAAAATILDGALELREAVHDVALGDRTGPRWALLAGWAARARRA